VGKSNYIPTLDGWRAIAILLVLVDHTIFHTFRHYGWTLVGGHGVQIFFVLSGYLITGKLLEDGSLRKFYTRRAFRILPVLLAYLAVVAFLGLFLHRIPVLRSEITTSLFFFRNWWFYPTTTWSGIGWFTAHLWSLSIEEQFYLIWPILMLKCGKGALRQMLAAVLYCGFFCAVFVLVHVGRILHIGGWHWMPNLQWGCLIVGCMLRIAFSDAGTARTISKFFTGRSTIVVLAVLVYIGLLHDRLTIFDPLFCGLAVCATLVEPNAWIGRILEISVLRWIGRLSYSLYIWQQLFLGFGPTFRPFGFFSGFPVNLVSAVVVACLSYYLMERPLMRLGHDLAARPTLVKSTEAVQAHAA
jgi:peptidoglycan/LPS O-acetylase OafA/YrhL